MAKSYKRKPKTGYKRKCHDCGKPTNAYRCPELMFWIFQAVWRCSVYKF